MYPICVCVVAGSSGNRKCGIGGLSKDEETFLLAAASSFASTTPLRAGTQSHSRVAMESPFLKASLANMPVEVLG